LAANVLTALIRGFPSEGQLPAILIVGFGDSDGCTADRQDETTIFAIEFPVTRFWYTLRQSASRERVTALNIPEDFYAVGS
jgi:hypothetical protein